MAIADVSSAAYPSPEEVHSQILSDVRYLFAQQGIEANVEVGSDHWIRAKAIANRISIAIQNNKLARDDMSPLTATDDALVTLAGVYGVYERPAAKAAGNADAIAVGSVTVPLAYQATAPNGEKYVTTVAVTGSGTFAVELQAVNAGAATNLVEGTILTWDSSAVGNLRQTLTVAAGGIDGGADADNEERLRARLVRRLAFPGVGGNWSEIAQWAEESTASVEAAFVYPAVRGPASYDVAITSAGGDRTLSGTVTSSVASYIESKMPGHADLNVTSVAAQEVDIVLDASLPLPQSAGGAGGGWRDTSPWPSTADAVLAKVTSVTSTTMTVNSTSADPPVAGAHFGIWNPTTGTMAQFIVSLVTGVSGAYVVTPDPTTSDSMAFVTAGMYVSAGAENLTTYAEGFADLLEGLGPGEKTTNAAILPRGRRQPGPDIEWPASLTNILLGRLSADFAEVLDLSYAARYDTGTTTTRTSPSIPATTADPPRLLVLKNLAFRRAV